MTLRYSVTPKLPIHPFTATKKVDDEKQARMLMKAIIKAKGKTVSNFKLYDPMENKFVELEK